jgi:hypothetical protein
LVFIYLPFLGVLVISDAVYALLFGDCSCAFLHLVSAGAVWAGILTFAFIVLMVKSTAFEAPCWG